MNTIALGRRPARIYVLAQTGSGLELRRIAAPARKGALKTHYNDDLSRLHPRLLRSLRSKGRPGLYLFCGLPGTGKRGYVRSLLSQQNKCGIFLDARMASAVETAELGSLLLHYPESVLVLEGAERLGSTALISRLFDCTDEIPGASLGIQVVCTFNTPLREVSEDLQQHRQLLGSYEFGPLSAEKARGLLRSEGAVLIPDAPATLGQIFKRRVPDFTDLT